jgi:hypothetical protein
LNVGVSARGNGATMHAPPQP